MSYPAPYIFFDLGETLIELRSLIASLAEVVRETFPGLGDAEAVSRRWALESVSRLPEASGDRFVTEHEIGSEVLREALKAAGFSIGEDQAWDLLTETRDRFVDRADLCPDVTTEWLAHVRGWASGLGIVTDGDLEYIPRILERLGIRKYFDSVTASNSVRAYKPAPEIYVEALRSLGATPSRSLFVSDASLDLQGASAVGIATAHVQRGLLTGSPGGLPSGTIKLNSLRELDPILARYAETGRFEPD